MDSGKKRRSAGLLQIGKADGDDEKGLEPFAQCNDKRLNHFRSSLGTSRDMNPAEQSPGKRSDND
jgi:hypothetical protein